MQVSFRVLCSKLACCFPIFRGSPLPSVTGAMLSACSVCVSQWVWHCGQGSWHRIHALNWPVCALVLHRPPTLHLCKHWTAGCRDVGTMEKQKRWTCLWPTSGPLNDRQDRWTRLSFSLHFYIVWMWVSATILKHRKGLASAWALVRGHCFHVFSIKHCSMKTVRWT